MKALLTDLFYVAFFIALSPWFLFRMATTGKYRAGLGQRLGFLPRRQGDRPCLWVHGVSVGEVASARTLIEAFRERFADWDVVVTTTTNTGQQTARRLYPEHLVFYYPLDLSFAVRKAFARIRPSLICLMELELWPNFLRLAEGRSIPVVLVNGVLSERSYHLHKRFLAFVRGMHRRLHVLAMQTQQYADRVLGLGVPAEKVLVTGNMKYDTIDTRPVEAPAELAAELTLRDGDQVLVAGSTHPGEEEVLIEAYTRLRERFGRLRLMIAPRHPERFEEVAGLLAKRGLAVYRRSRGDVSGGGEQPPVILIDTLGELVSMYRFAGVVFVGATLVPLGGHNVMEPAGLGKMPIVGPHTFKTTEAVQLLLARQAMRQVADGEELVRVLAELLADPVALAEAGERARQVVIENQGATERNLELLSGIVAELPSAGGPDPKA